MTGEPAGGDEFVIHDREPVSRPVDLTLNELSLVRGSVEAVRSVIMLGGIAAPFARGDAVALGNLAARLDSEWQQRLAAGDRLTSSPNTTPA